MRLTAGREGRGGRDNHAKANLDARHAHAHSSVLEQMSFWQGSCGGMVWMLMYTARLPRVSPASVGTGTKPTRASSSRAAKGIAPSHSLRIGVKEQY